MNINVVIVDDIDDIDVCVCPRIQWCIEYRFAEIKSMLKHLPEPMSGLHR